METKWIVAVLIFVIALVIFLIVRNQKDKKELEKFLNETEMKDHEKPIKDEIE